MVTHLGVIGGSSLLNSNMKYQDTDVIVTKYGKSHVHKTPDFVFIQRHGQNMDILPHLINHKANIGAMKILGVKNIIGIGSTGSYKRGINPGSIVIPDDYVNIYQNETYYDSRIIDLFSGFTIPDFDEEIRERIIEAAKHLKIKVIKRGVYFQVPGPRFETKAEVRMFSNFGDIVGMTIASEALLAQETGIGYAAICSVDNYGRGIKKKEIDVKEIEAIKEETTNKILKIIQRLK